MIMKKGTFIVVVGPSAAGKTELVKALLKKIPNSARLVTSTTRERRPEEKPTDYFFISREEFEKGIADDKFF
jgi:guanylate kinase